MKRKLLAPAQIEIDANNTMAPVQRAPPKENMDTVDSDPIAKRRLQYKMYQRRHRAKQRDKTQGLELEVARLHHEIAQLELMKISVASPSIVPRDPYPVQPPQLVREYLRLFCHGYSPNSSTQHAFVRSVMCPDMCGPQLYSADHVLRQWRLYERVFSSVHLTVQQLYVEQLGSLCIIRASVTMAIRIRRANAMCLFPSLSYRDPQLVQQLVGSIVTVEGWLRFGFDSAGRMNWLSSEMDFVRGLLQALGSLDKVVQLAPDSQIDLSTGYISAKCEVQ